jgi:hypothetical protein
MTRKTRYFMLTSAAILAVGLCTGLLAYFGGLPTQAARSSTGPDELKYVPAGAAVVAYANVREVMDSEFRHKLHAVLPHHDEKGSEEFKRETGIDIERDIDYVLAWMAPGKSEHSHGGFALLKGRFDAARLEAVAVQHGGQVEDVQGVRTIRLNKKGHEGNERALIAFLETGLLAIGEEQSVRGAIGSRGGGASVLSNKELMDLMADLDGSSDVWAVGRMDVLTQQTKIPEQIASQLPALKTFSASSNVNGGVSALLRAEARDEQAAQNLRDVVQGAMALAKLQAGNKPELQPFLQSIELGGSGTTVAVSFELPTSFIDAMTAKSKKPEN